MQFPLARLDRSQDPHGEDGIKMEKASVRLFRMTVRMSGRVCDSALALISGSIAAAGNGCAPSLAPSPALRVVTGAVRQVKSSEVHLHGYSSAFPRTCTRPAVSQLCFETIPYPHLPHGYLPTVL